MDKEKEEFVQIIAKRKNLQIVIVNNLIVTKDQDYTYEEFVGKFFDISDAKIGMLAIINNTPKVLLPYNEGTAWFDFNSMESDAANLTLQKMKNPVTALYSLTNLKKGYFSQWGRVKLYDSSWKPLELTIDQIAEKFGVKPEQIRIKK